MSGTGAVSRAGASATAGRAAGTPGGPAGGSALGWLVVAVPAVAAFAVGGYALGGSSLWRDEAYTREVITRPAGQIVTLLGRQDVVHGAYYMLMHVITEWTGTSATALRLPSVVAMALAAAFTAATARRLAEVAGGPAPRTTGLLAGLVFATAPSMTYYAQDAREFGIVTMLACIASYLFVRAAGDGGRGWWPAYGLAVALTCYFNLFAALIVVAHAISLWIARARVRAPGSRAGRARIAGIPAGWWAAVVAAGIVAIPLLLTAYRQQGQIGWLTAPRYGTVVKLVTDFAGSRALIVPIAVLAAGGAVAGFAARRDRPLSPGTVALPWLVVPPAILLAVSFAHPVYDERYVEFCLPALAILVAAGLAWLGRLLAATPVSRLGIAWLPSAVIAVALAALLVAPQRTIRLSSAKPDNLRKAAAIVAANEQPGDVVFYMPGDAPIIGQGYPAPFRKLRDLAQASSPRASDSLNGTQVSPQVLRERFTNVRRVWFVTGQANHKFPVAASAIDKEKMSLVSGMHIVHRWMANEVMLTLYAR